MEKLRFKNFTKIKAIDEARALKIIKWYEKTPYQIAIMAGCGCGLDSLSLITLLSILANSKNIERDINALADKIGLFENAIDRK